ncbi:MAG TPA: carbohydrate ABC transporter permease, partial [Methylomirabilota bacterium]|nr:carbohydrate ABC transporter permease [Methylomirabilota bacterium]
MIGRVLRRIAFATVVAAIVVYAVFPFYWAIVTSFRSGQAIFSTALIPGRIDLANYAAVFTEQPFGRNILNSLVVATVTVALSLLLAVPASYALGRVAFRGRSVLLFAFLAVSMFPQIAVLSGMFEIIQRLGLYNRLLGLSLSYLLLTLPFTVWVLTAFMRDLPREIEEAAVVDGASPFVLIWRVLLPLMAPAIVATGLLAFIAAWNEFLFALTFTLSSETRTVPVAIALI